MNRYDHPEVFDDRSCVILTTPHGSTVVGYATAENACKQLLTATKIYLGLDAKINYATLVAAHPEGCKIEIK